MLSYAICIYRYECYSLRVDLEKESLQENTIT
jgi:hypothetical protein